MFAAGVDDPHIFFGLGRTGKCLIVTKPARGIGEECSVEDHIGQDSVGEGLRIR
jgi:hypothetical protein